jgi:hypothetical protein
VKGEVHLEDQRDPELAAIMQRPYHNHLLYRRSVFLVSQTLDADGHVGRPLSSKSVCRGEFLKVRQNDMKKTNLIKVPARVPQPGKHADLTPHPTGKLFHTPTIPGQVIFTLGPPHEPHAGWFCGTDVVWPVLEINGVKIQRDEFGRLPYVCRHQIEAGD